MVYLVRPFRRVGADVQAGDGHGALFPAVILREKRADPGGRRSSTGQLYFVHFSGWNKRYDTWMRPENVQPLSEGGGDMFWRIKNDGLVTTVNFGRVGIPGRRSEPKTHPSLATATKFMDQQVESWQQAGYVEQPDPAGSICQRFDAKKMTAHAYAHVVGVTSKAHTKGQPLKDEERENVQCTRNLVCTRPNTHCGQCRLRGAAAHLLSVAAKKCEAAMRAAASVDQQILSKKQAGHVDQPEHAASASAAKDATQAYARSRRHQNRDRSSEHYGVSYCSADGRWRTSLVHRGQKKLDEKFDIESVAAEVWDAAARKHRGILAHGGKFKLNFPTAAERAAAAALGLTKGRTTYEPARASRDVEAPEPARRAGTQSVELTFSEVASSTAAPVDQQVESMNVEQPSASSRTVCTATGQTPAASVTTAGRIECGSAVQCDTCSKWRLLLPTVQSEDLPRRFTCDLDFWDKAKLGCAAPETPHLETLKATPPSGRTREGCALDLAALHAVHGEAKPQASAGASSTDPSPKSDGAALPTMMNAGEAAIEAAQSVNGTGRRNRSHMAHGGRPHGAQRRCNADEKFPTRNAEEKAMVTMLDGKAGGTATGISECTIEPPGTLACTTPSVAAAAGAKLPSGAQTRTTASGSSSSTDGDPQGHSKEPGSAEHHNYSWSPVVGEDVLARDGDRGFFASVILQKKGGEGSEIGEKWMVHYNGWNKRHDKWLPPDDVRPVATKSTQRRKRDALQTETSPSLAAAAAGHVPRPVGVLNNELSENAKIEPRPKKKVKIAGVAAGHMLAAEAAAGSVNQRESRLRSTSTEQAAGGQQMWSAAAQARAEQEDLVATEAMVEAEVAELAALLPKSASTAGPPKVFGFVVCVAYKPTEVFASRRALDAKHGAP